jgi:hypothetical protein
MMQQAALVLRPECCSSAVCLRTDVKSHAVESQAIELTGWTRTGGGVLGLVRRSHQGTCR